MSTPFRWESIKTQLLKPTNRSLPQELRDAVDNMFEGTFNPEQNRKDWLIYLKDNRMSGKLSQLLNVKKSSDLTLMLPPINDVELPLLDKMRESLSGLNRDACCYPYSARCASDIKRLVNTFNSVFTKAGKISTERNAVINTIKTISSSKFRLQRELLTGRLRSLATKNANLADLSNKIIQLERVNKKAAKLKEEFDKAEKYVALLKDKIERIFFARNNWKFKDMRGGAMGTDGFMVRNPHDDELFGSARMGQDGTFVSHHTILEAIQEATEPLQTDNIDIHPEPWKNLLIIPNDTKNLPKGWKQPTPSQAGKAYNNLLPSGRSVRALKADWAQFATFGVDGWQNELQKALAAPVHSVHLHAQVQIGFDKDYGTIRPSVPWWDNSILANQNKTQIGAMRDLPDGKHDRPPQSSGFVSQVGFVWEYKIPQHSRATLADTPWEMAMDQNDDPYGSFNLPRGTSAYAVRLSFIRADGSVVPISNVLSGRDVDRHFKSKVSRTLNGDSSTRNANFTTVSIGDQMRLTNKAIALIGGTSGKNVNRIQNALKSERVKLNTYDILFTDVNEKWHTIEDMRNIVKRRMADIQIVFDDAVGWADPAGDGIDDALNKLETDYRARTGAILAGTTGARGQSIFLVTQLTKENIVGTLDSIGGALNRNPKFTRADFPYNENVPVDPVENNIDIFVQCKLIMEDTEVNWNNMLAAKDKTATVYNCQLDIVQSYEREANNWMGNIGDILSNDTEHAPGLISKERELNQIASFLDYSWDELISVANPAGKWDPMVDPLPKAACLHLEPWLRKYKNEERLGFLNMSSLRASNWSANSPQPDVDSECLEHSYTSWNAGEDAIASVWRAQRAQSNYSSRAEKMIEEYYASQNTVVAREFAENAASMAAERKYNERISALERTTELAIAQQEAKKKRFEDDMSNDSGTAAQISSGRARALQYIDDAALAGDAAKKALADQLRTVEADLSNITKTGGTLEAIEAKISLQASIIQQLGTAKLKLQNPSSAVTASMAPADLALKLDVATKALSDAQIIQDGNSQVLVGLRTDLHSLERDKAKLYAGINRDFNTFLQSDIDSASTKIEDLKKKMDEQKRNFEATKELDQRRFTEESELLNRMVKEVDSTFRAKMRYGDICMGRENLDTLITNGVTKEHEKVSAPADLRFGGGYLWKYADQIDKTIPLGEYLVYKEKTGHKNRISRAWSGVGLSQNEGKKDENGEDSIGLYESPSAAVTGSLRLVTKNDFVQPVLTDQIQVSKSGHIAKTLFKLNASTGASPSTSTDEVYYMGTGVDVGVGDEATIDGFRTPFKPGSYVYFRLKKRNASSSGPITSIRGKIYDKCVEIPKDVSTDSTLDIVGGLVVSGIIKTIRIMNLATAVDGFTMDNALKEVEEAKALLLAAGTDVAKREIAVLNLATKLETLTKLQRANGKFDYETFSGVGLSSNEWGPDNTAMIPILVADIVIANGIVIKNVPYAEINRVLPVQYMTMTNVLYNVDGYWRRGMASTSSIKSHDNLIIYSQKGLQHVPIEVHSEDVRPLYENGTNVIYNDGTVLSVAQARHVGNGKYELTDSFGNPIAGQSYRYPDDISLLVSTAKDAVDTIEHGNTNMLSMSEEGLEYTTFLPKWTKIVNDATDVSENQVKAFIQTNFSAVDIDNNIQSWSTDVDKVKPLFRAVIRPKRKLRTCAVDSSPIGTSDATMVDALAKMNAVPSKLKIDGTSQDMDDVVCWVSYFGTATDASPNDYSSITHNDNDGNAIDGSFVQIVTINDSRAKEVMNVRWDEIKEILLPQVGANIGDFKATSGVGYRHVNFFRGAMATAMTALGIPEPQIWNIKPKFVRAAVKASQLETTFALSSGTEGDSETQMDDEEDAKGWTSSWAKTEQVIQTWASSTSDSSEAEMAHLSGTDMRSIPAWATSSSSDEKVVESNDSAWASSTSMSKHSGGFASATSEDDMDDLSAIISKIERGSNQQSAAWAEDSESDD
jgi:hypothetical protein